MASTGEADRKRRHVSSISPTAAAAMAKKQPFAPLSEDKKVLVLANFVFIIIVCTLLIQIGIDFSVSVAIYVYIYMCYVFC